MHVAPGLDGRASVFRMIRWADKRRGSGFTGILLALVLLAQVLVITHDTTAHQDDEPCGLCFAANAVGTPLGVTTPEPQPVATGDSPCAATPSCIPWSPRIPWQARAPPSPSLI